MKRKFATVLIVVGGVFVTASGVASAAPKFDGKCLGSGVAAAAKANASFGFDVPGFVRDLKTGDCATP